MSGTRRPLPAGRPLAAVALLALMALLAAPLAAQGPGTVLAEAKIADGGLADGLDDGDLFGSSVANVGDLDGDGVTDLAVGASRDDDGGEDRGAVWVLFLNADGTVRDHQKVSSTEGGFTGTLGDGDGFGWSITALGDLDGDGVTELAVGAKLDDGWGLGQDANRGAVWILFLNADGTVASQQEISDTAGGFTGALDNGDGFGASMASIGDLDGDGVTDLAVGANGDDDGGSSRGAVWVLFLHADGTVKAHQKISDTEGGFTGPLDDWDHFGTSVSSLGDLDGDGVTDLAVGAGWDSDGGAQRGAVWVLFLNADGTVRDHQKISDTEGGFTGALDDWDHFGWSVSLLEDLDGDGVSDLAVGAFDDDDGGTNRGAVWALFLNADGTVKAYQKISSTAGGFIGPLSNFDFFGASVAPGGDLDGDGVTDLAVSAPRDDEGGQDRGAVWVLFLDGAGSPPLNYDLTVTPMGPLTVPPGGDLSFAYTVTNNTASSVTGDLYFVARRGGSPVAQAVVRSGTLPSRQTIQGTTTLGVSGGAPQGSYALTFSIGRAFGQAVDSETFTVTVEGATLREGGEAWAVAYASPWSPVTTTASAAGTPTTFALHGARPNPSAGQATLRYDVPAAGTVRLVVYDVLGRRVAVLVDGVAAAGTHAAVLEGGALPSGVYVVRLEAGGQTWTKRLTVLR